MNFLIHRIIEKYLRLRLRGKYTFKPPLGWHSDFHHPRFHKKWSYFFQYWFWKFEINLLEKHGATIQKEWKEKYTWESFLDAAYYDYWAVRPVGEKHWGVCFHLCQKEEAEGLAALLTQYNVPWEEQR